MSIAWSNRAWRHSQASGSRLLLLLALADNADDETGVAWPSIGYLCRKTRMLERRVQHGLRWLEALGEIQIEPRTGTSNAYRLTVQGGVKTGGGVKKGGGPSDTQNQEEGAVAALLAEHCVKTQEQPQDPTTLNPAANSTKSKSEAEAFVEAYHRLCPSLPRCRKITQGRQQRIATRLRELPLGEWEQVFALTNASAFHTGTNDRGWVADLDWLTKNAENGLKILERGSAVKPVVYAAGGVRYRTPEETRARLAGLK